LRRTRAIVPPMWKLAALALVGCSAFKPDVDPSGSSSGGTQDGGNVSGLDSAIPGTDGGTSGTVSVATVADTRHTDEFVAEADRTVLDSKTGMRWQNEALPQSTWDEAQRTCAQSRRQGKTGWRLPTKLELVSLIDFTGAKALPDPFVGTESEMWTSVESPRSSASKRVWVVQFSPVGNAATRPATSAIASPKCVLGDPILPARLRKGTADTMVDDVAKLEWRVSPTTSTPIGRGNLATDCAGGWRFPTMKELASILDDTRIDGPFSDPQLLHPGASPLAYWSSTEAASATTSNRLSVSFTNSDFTLETQGYVRCVRGLP
jgi:Protein of unknown function (DUF1566)